jgi:lipopolysaccharide/colanic/teichoic acid biosynthesis glycosyltransferase
LEDLVFKRIFDVALSVFLLALTLPLMASAAVIVKLDSEGPVIFRQERMGRNFRRFWLYKLRTMNLYGDGPAYTLGADPRITRAGRWLRKFKIDELPQLWNVLRGEMSLVGPRPVIPSLAIEFDCAYTRLLSVRPGLTDPASLRYSNETEILARAADPLRYFKTVVTPEKLRISQDYLQRADALSDLSIMFWTVLVLLSPSLREQFSRQIPSELASRVKPHRLSMPPLNRKFQPFLEDSPANAPIDIPAALIKGTRRPRLVPKGKVLSL